MMWNNKLRNRKIKERMSESISVKVASIENAPCGKPSNDTYHTIAVCKGVCILWVVLKQQGIDKGITLVLHEASMAAVHSKTPMFN